MINRHICGFKLIEVAVVLAIVGILAAIAIPNYQDYTTRSRVAEALVFADAARTPVIEKLMRNQNIKADLLNNANQAVDMMTALEWHPANSGDPVQGYILPTMDLPRLGNRHALALELRNNGNWYCVNAAKYVDPKTALDEKYLPPSCHDGAGPVGPHKDNPKPCSNGTQPILVEDANHIKHMACFPACSSGKSRDPATLKCPSTPQPAQTQPPAPACPQGQVCAPDDKKCPNGKASNGQCIPTCQKGWEVSHTDNSRCTLSGSPNPHVCRGPKFICERAHGPDGKSCPQDKPFAANVIENLHDGSRYVTRSCISVKDAYQAAQHNRNNSECGHYDVDDLVGRHFSCTYPCYGENCNDKTVPLNGIPTWDKQIKDSVTGQLRDKTASDLPDMFD